MEYPYCHYCGDETSEPIENLCPACWVQVQADLAADLAADAKMAFFESEAAVQEAEADDDRGNTDADPAGYAPQVAPRASAPHDDDFPF